MDGPLSASLCLISFASRTGEYEADPPNQQPSLPATQTRQSDVDHFHQLSRELLFILLMFCDN
jgi:hypothetical protein